MAKKKPAAPVANRSDVIREVLHAQPKATVKEIRAVLDERGVKASDALINKIKYGRGKTSGRKRSARTNGHGSKANAIRLMFDRLGLAARPRDVVAALADRGIKVTPAQVSTLRKKGARPGSRTVVVSAVSFDHLVAAKELVERLGSIEAARGALEKLAQLVGNS